MDDLDFDFVCAAIEEKGINTEGFDTEELMVAAFLTGAASCFDAIVGTAEDVNAALKKRYNEEELL